MKKFKEFFTSLLTKNNLIKGIFMLLGLALNLALSFILDAILNVGIYNINTFRDYGVVTCSYSLLGILFIYAYAFGLDKINITVKEYTIDKSTFEKGITKLFLSGYIISCGWNPIIVSAIHAALKLIPGFSYEFFWIFSIARIICMIVSFLPFFLFIKWIDKLEANQNKAKEEVKQENTYPTFEILTEEELLELQSNIYSLNIINEDTLILKDILAATSEDAFEGLKSPDSKFNDSHNL